jgi:hypothetical protein
MEFSPIHDENHDKLYTFSLHAIEQLETQADRRELTWELIGQAINNPTETHPSPTGAEERHLQINDN